MDAVAPFSGLLKTRRIEPMYHSNLRTEFRINDPAEAVLTNLRLVNIGAVTTAAARPHESIGLHALIKHIRLEGNGREIDSQRLYNRLMLFREGIVDSNTDQISMQKTLSKSRRGLTQFVEKFSTSPAAAGPPIANSLFEASPQATNGQFTTDPATTATAMIELRNVLGFLRATPLMHPAAMGEIRLIIEWDADVAVPNAAGAPNPVTITSVLPPTLICTYSRDPGVIDQAVRSLAQPITFSTFFVDSNTVPAIAPGNVEIQTVPFQFKAFDGHYVQRMLQINEPLGVGAEINQARNVLQSCPRFFALDKVFVNSVPMFGASGIDTAARRNTLLHDAFEGTHTHAPGADTVGQLNDTTSKGDEYTGYLIGRHVAIFQTEFSRTVIPLAGGTAPVNSRTNQALVVRMFGEVFRTRMPNGTVVALATQ
jgi:hypothetical protein